jgi:predicted helicase
MENIKKIIINSVYKENIFDNICESITNYGFKGNTILELRKYNSNISKGNLFENLCLLCLKKNLYLEEEISEVWLLKDVPSEIKKKLKLKKNDYGIDLIIEYKNKHYGSVQCKFRSRKKKKISIPWKDLSTFFSLSYKSGPYLKHIVMTNADYIKDVGMSNQKDTAICYKVFNKLTKEDWLKIINLFGNKISDTDNNSKTLSYEEICKKRLEYFKQQA